MKPTVFISSSGATHALLHSLQEELSRDAKVVTWADSPFPLHSLLWLNSLVQRRQLTL
jgi:hypothetical protein